MLGGRSPPEADSRRADDDIAPAVGLMPPCDRHAIDVLNDVDDVGGPISVYAAHEAAVAAASAAAADKWWGGSVGDGGSGGNGGKP